MKKKTRNDILIYKKGCFFILKYPFYFMVSKSYYISKQNFIFLQIVKT